jgi:hypothetical protein
MNVRRLLLLVALLVGCSRGEPRASTPAPSPAPAAFASKTPVPAVVPEPTPSPTEEALQTSLIEVRVVTPTPVDPASIPNFDRRAEPTSGSATEQRARCLTYTVERETFGESRRVKVRVRNACAIWIPVEESFFEISAMPSSGQGIAGRATGSFQTPIGPHSSNVETFIEVDCPGDVRGGCKYYVEPR